MIKQVRKTLRGSAGFTLVELVVVIAVLGILAGVGTVGYSGYIQRANEAVDDTLYHDIIYAGAIGSYADPGVTGSVTVDKAGASTENVTIAQWMSNAFGSDWQGTVKYKTDTYANGSTTGTIYLPAVEIKLTEPQKELVNKYEDSNFYGNETELAGTVDNLADMLADWMKNGSGVSALKSFLGEDYQTFLDEYVNNPEYVSDSTDLQQVANAMVFFLADKAKDVTADAVFGMATDENGNIDTGKLEEVMAEYGLIPTAGMLYGLMTGYANSDLASGTFKTQFKENPPSGIDEVMAMLGQMGSDANSGQYLKDQGKQDLDGYLSALKLIGDNKDKIDITVDTSAFKNDSVLALLQGILNGK